MDTVEPFIAAHHQEGRWGAVGGGGEGWEERFCWNATWLRPLQQAAPRAPAVRRLLLPAVYGFAAFKACQARARPPARRRPPRPAPGPGPSGPASGPS